ncbi:hypothetical protein KJ840_04525 [Patescibacteria group bacterium]|nr:hypothetical protein [Patescibacteria group bacterium]
MSEEKNQQQEEHKKKKHGLGKILFKLITLGGLLALLYRFFQKNQVKSDSKK